MSFHVCSLRGSRSLTHNPSEKESFNLTTFEHLWIDVDGIASRARARCTGT